MKTSLNTLLFYGLFILLISDSCKKKSKIEEKYADFDIEEMQPMIEQHLKQLRNDTNFTHYFDTLFTVYEEKAFAPQCLIEIQDSMLFESIKKINDSLVYEGLKPMHYKLDTVIKYLSIAKKQKVPEIYESLALADLYFTNFLIAVWHDKVLGRTNPKDVLGMKYTLPFPNHPNFNLLEVLDKDSGIIKLIQYNPQHKDYLLLRKMLRLAYSQTNGSETFIDTVGIRKIKPGDTCTIASRLAIRLVELGLAPDSLVEKYKTETVYKKELSNYVKAFQKTSNLTDDGIIGKSTLKILNASKNDKIDEIRANIERIKWFGLEPPKPYIRVNIPEFTLYMHYVDSVQTLLVCVGKGKERYYDSKQKKYVVSKNYSDKPMNHETPQIYSNIDWVVLNPTWTVPSSIVGREMYAHILKDPGYLNRNNYQVLKDGVPVNPYSINWRRLSPGNIPYTIRQNAGDDNSLGKIKFTFKNPFDVYLHDTPLKNKFQQNNRAVSHGCVRVQSPVDLTGFVLQANVKKSYDDVLEMMGIEPKDTGRARLWREDTSSYKKIIKTTKFIKVENPLIVFFDYRTIVFDEFQMPRYVFDVYDKNSLIIEALNKP
jgi:murein L,D-transpeptidase YcbB/YkuD